MEHHLTKIIIHMSRSYHELAKIIHSKRHMTVHMAQMIQLIPDTPSFSEPTKLVDNVGNVSDSISAYLTTLADLEDAIAENLGYIVSELSEASEE